MTKRRAPQPSLWQKNARSQLRALAAAHPDDLQVRMPGELVEGTLLVEITLNTKALSNPAPGGLVLGGSEDFLLAIFDHPLHPPQVYVQHARFLGFPHVLAGHVLCLYLDVAREWQPSRGIPGVLNRLWQWLDDAVNARFDAATALYHAVGGVPHATEGTPTIVVRHPLVPNRRVQTGHLVRRSPERYDHLAGPADENSVPMPVVILPHDLPFGAGRDRLVDLLTRVDHADRQSIPAALRRPSPGRRLRLRLGTRVASAVTGRLAPCRDALGPAPLWPEPPPIQPAPPRTTTGLLTVLAASASRQPDGAPQDVLLAVPHPAGGPPHLLGLRLPAEVSDILRRVVRTRETPILNISSDDVFPDITMEWCYVSDERQAVSVRRDDTRPVNALTGKTIHVWGCGGLGSWIAEFAVRAGAATVVLCDASVVTGGLLVRQNFTELDVGGPKAAGLAERLRAISDATTVEVREGMLPADWETVATDADLIIDATISNAIAEVTAVVGATPGRRATIAQVATDARSGSLGLAIVTPPGGSPLKEIDHAAGVAVKAAADLEPYKTFWSDPGVGDELVPTRGCSAPTFHGSAADMAGIAGALLSFIAMSLEARTPGTHLMALPQSGVSPTHRFIPHAPTETAEATSEDPAA